MDPDSYKLIEFYHRNLQFIGTFITNIWLLSNHHSMPGVDDIQSSDLKNKYNTETKIIIDDIITSLKEYHNYLENNKIEAAKTEINTLIEKIDSVIATLSEQNYFESLGYFCPLLFELRGLFLDFLFTSKQILNYIGQQYNHRLENQELYYPNFIVEAEAINTKYAQLIASIKLDQPKKFLESSSASFRSALVQYNQPILNTVCINQEYKKEVKENVRSNLISCLFLFVSAYEKIIYSLYYMVGLKENENELKLHNCTGRIKDKNLALGEAIITHPKKTDVELAIEWRNALTHRLLDIELEEIKGRLATLIKEIHRALKIYSEYVEKQTGFILD